MKNIKDQDMDLENVRQSIVAQLQTKAEFRDIESLNQRLHQKVDLEKLQQSVAELRHDISNQVSSTKKDSSLISKRREEDLNGLRTEFENVQLKNGKDINAVQDKI